MRIKVSRAVRAVVAIFFTTILFSDVNLRAEEKISRLIYRHKSVSFSNSSDEKKLLDLINIERRKRNLSSLIWDSKLANMARSYSGKMARENFFGHTDSSGKNLKERAKEANISDWSGLGENLYYCKGYNEPTMPALRGWLKSPGHRRNLLKVAWQKTGIGIAKSTDGRIYVTQVFMN